MSKTQLAIVGGAVIFIILMVLLFVGVLPGLKTDQLTKHELTVWGLTRDENAMKEAIGRYIQINSNVTIKYLGIPEAEYEEVLIDNLAAGTGPDILLLRNDWFQKHKNKILYATEDIITPAEVQELFPEVVGADFISENNVYGLPLSIDTLALAYNRGIFDVKQIAVPPTTWDGIKIIVPKLRELVAGKIQKGAIAAGATDDSVLNARDIVTVLMMQKDGFTYSSESNEVRFANQDSQNGLNLYDDFGDPKSPNYAWDPALGDSIDAFANGNVAMTLLYSSQLPMVLAKNPIINMATLPLPQLNHDKPKNIARYWSLAVSNRTGSYAQAWDFVKFAATDSATASAYAISSGSPPALRSLIASYSPSGNLKAFVPQALTAKSWPVPDSARVSRIFNDMIKSTLADRSDSAMTQALRIAEAAVNQLFHR